MAAGPGYTYANGVFTVSSDDGLNAAIANIDAIGKAGNNNGLTTGAYTIRFNQNITLDGTVGGTYAAVGGANAGQALTIDSGSTPYTVAGSSQLYALNLSAGVSVTIDGGGYTLDGNGANTTGAAAYNGFFVFTGQVGIQNLTIANTLAMGGNGGNGSRAGGGGAGLGGGLFVSSQGNVTLSSVNFNNNAATGGAGGTAGPGSFGGGGGFGGNGGNAAGGYGGGGGGIGQSASGGSNGPGGPGIVLGAAAGGTADQPGGPNGGGGGSSSSSALSQNSGGGIGPVFPSAGYGGGSGGNLNDGGFGGGSGGNGGRGGFGGGTGGRLLTAQFQAGYGAGQGGEQSGGGGLGAGGAIFVQNGGTLKITGTGTLGAGTVSGGASGAGDADAVAGTGLGSGIFLQGNQTLALETIAGETLTVAGGIADQTGSRAQIGARQGYSDGAGALNIGNATAGFTGIGRVKLSAVNTYTGGTTLTNGGTLELVTLSSAGSGVITFGSNNGETLQLDASGVLGNRISGFGGLDNIDLNTVTAAGATLVQSTSGGVTTLTITEAAASGSDSNTISIDPAPVDRRYALSADRADGSALIQLLDLPQYSIAVAARQNGNNVTTSYPEGTGTGSGSAIEYLITRSGDSSQAGSVNVSFTGGATPPGGANADYNISAAQGVYQATGVGTGVVSFAAGQSGVRIFANTTPDSVSEADETLTVSLTGVASGGGNIDPQIQNFATATIANDDMAPTLALSRAISSRAEGNTGTTPFSFNVTRTGDAQQMQTVQYVVTGSGANPASSSDFDPAYLSGIVRFEQGQMLQQIVIPVIGETNFEPDETFTVTLSNPNFGTITTATATGTIINDDAAPSDPSPTGPTSGDDNLIGTAGPDTASLGLGNDTFAGGSGSDLVYGNQGNDLIYGNQDADTLYGGQGDDRAYGGQGDDRLYGNLGNDVLYGNLGNDVVYGNQGSDIVYGNQGADILFGGQDNDMLYGGQDNDTLVGGVGDDTLVGGLGADLYRFDANSGRDLILGFNQADGDRIALGGQTYTVSSAQNGDALLTLSGGGVVDLAGIRADQVNASYFA